MKQTRWKIAAFILSLLSLLPVSSLWAAPKGKKPNPEATQALLAAAMDAEGDDILAALEQGADPLVKDENDNTVLMLAVMGNFFGDEGEKAIDALVKAKVPVEAKNKAGQTALMLAAREGQADNVQLLIARGAKVNERDSDGWTPLMLAAYNGQVSAVDLLLKAKADFKVKDSKGVWDALMIALAEGRGGVAEKLIEAGAVIPTGPVGNLTPLVHSVYGGDLRSVRLILATKPDLGARDKDGWSALELAAYNNYPQIAMELLRAGIDPALKDKEGKTALDRAQENKSSRDRRAARRPVGPPEDRRHQNRGPLPRARRRRPGGLRGSRRGPGRDDDLPEAVVVLPGRWQHQPGGQRREVHLPGIGGAGLSLRPDSKRQTGRKADPLTKGAEGAEYSLEYMEYGTSVTLSYRGVNDEELSKQVFANVLSADLTKAGEMIPPDSLGDYSPEAANNNGVLETTIPLSLLGVQKGKKVRVVATVGSCGPKEAMVPLP